MTLSITFYFSAVVRIHLTQTLNLTSGNQHTEHEALENSVISKKNLKDFL